MATDTVTILVALPSDVTSRRVPKVRKTFKPNAKESTAPKLMFNNGRNNEIPQNASTCFMRLAAKTQMTAIVGEAALIESRRATHTCRYATGIRKMIDEINQSLNSAK